MKRLLIVGLILVLCLFLSSCSYSTEFVVINNSQSPIEVEFIIASDFPTLEHTAMQPYKTSTSNWNSWFERIDWQKVSQENYEFDSQLHKVKVKLNPNEVLRIAIALHHESILPTADYEFPIKTLRLDGENGESIYSGRSFYKQFEKKDDNKYFIEYK